MTVFDPQRRVRQPVRSHVFAMRFAAAMLVLFGIWPAAALGRGPAVAPGTPPPPVSFHQPITAGLIRCYQSVISPSKGSHCPMTPHCSAFGLQAFQTRDPLTAFILTSDRLHRCGHDLGHYDLALVDGQPRFVDPLPAPRGQAAPSAEPSEPQPMAPTMPPSAAGVSSPPADDAQAKTQLLAFAESLETYGDLPRAITEYLRYLAYYPDDAATARAYIGLVRAHYLQRGFEDVIRLGRQAPTRCSPAEVAEIRYYVGLAYYGVENHPAAQRTFAELAQGGIEPYASKASVLSAASLAHLGRWQESGAAFAAVPSTNPYWQQAQLNVAICDAAADPNLKSPSLAGVLSIVPGLGYAYAGYPKTAFSAFLVTSGFIWATVESFDRGNEGLGALLGVLSFGWYSGNIYGAVESAHRYNDWDRDRTLGRLEFGFVF